MESRLWAPGLSRRGYVHHLRNSAYKDLNGANRWASGPCQRSATGTSRTAFSITPDDRTIDTWRTPDWNRAKDISEPIKPAILEENSMTFRMAISWSPCDIQLITTNASRKTGTHHAPMFSRQNGFDDPTEFAGRRGLEISSWLSPTLYRTGPRISNEPKATGTSVTVDNS